MKFKLINSKDLSFVYLFICCFFVGCSSGVKVQTIKDTTKTKETPDILREQLDQGLANAITYFEEHFASIENDQVVMSLELLSQEFQLGMNLPNIENHSSMIKKIKENYFRLYGRSFANLKMDEVDINPISEEEFKKIEDQFDNSKNIRKQVFLLCDKLELPFYALTHFKESLDNDISLYPEYMFHLKNIIEDSCFAEELNYMDEITNGFNVIEQFFDETSVQTLSVKLEALAMVGYIQPGTKLLSKDKVVFVLDAQLENGSWPDNYKNNQTSTYNTLMGLWVLLQYDRIFNPK